MHNNITNIKVLTSSSSQIDPPTGYVVVPVDLNSGAGGRYVFIAHKRDPRRDPITDLMIVSGENPTVPYGYKLIKTDLNAGAGGDYIWLCYTHNRKPQEPLYDLQVRTGSRRSDAQQSVRDYYRNRYELDPFDLNKGAEGDYVYLHTLYQDRHEKVPLPGQNYRTEEMVKGSRFEIDRYQIGKERMLVRFTGWEIAYQGTSTPGKHHELKHTLSSGTTEESRQSFAHEFSVSATVGTGEASPKKAEATISYTFTHQSEWSFEVNREETFEESWHHEGDNLLQHRIAQQYITTEIHDHRGRVIETMTDYLKSYRKFTKRSGSRVWK